MYVKHEGDDDDDDSVNWCAWNGLQRLGKGTISVGNQRANVDHLDCSVVEIS